MGFTIETMQNRYWNTFYSDIVVLVVVSMNELTYPLHHFIAQKLKIKSHWNFNNN